MSLTSQKSKVNSFNINDAKGSWVYSFGNGKADGSAKMRDLLGGKGANLAEMCNLGLPVPPGFTVSTDVCTYYYSHDSVFPIDLSEEIEVQLSLLEERVGARFGDFNNPLLVSVRSGSRASMPGMMDTVLNLGLNDKTVEGLANKSGDPRFAYDSYRRFIQMFGDVVMGVDHYLFEEALDNLKLGHGITLDTELSAKDLQQLVNSYKNIIISELNKPFPQNAKEQLWDAIAAVFGSWMNQRAKTYRRIHEIPADWGTAVNIQAMVFGNMGNNCATGVAFTRDPSTGENIFYGEYLCNAQGEDVVAGIRTPQHLTLAGREKNKSKLLSMEEVMPDVFSQLSDVRSMLELHYKDMQDIEFTVQQGKLYMLQTRTGKRTAAAAVRIAVEMVDEGLIDQIDAINRVDPVQLEQLLHPRLDPKATRNVLTRALPASPGAASGKIVFSADIAEDMSQKGEDVILVRIETSPEDIHGMHAARAILTTRGGMTSHAAVVARGMGRPCVAGAGEILINYADEVMSIGGRNFSSGDFITIDGGKGEVIEGSVPTIEPEVSGGFARLMEWADKVRKMKVRANAETPADVMKAKELGAEGIGLCRTEHMFFDPERIVAVRQMIMADGETGRRDALNKLLPFQRNDFEEIFRIMSGLPVTIRLLDPPLHEFLPHSDEEIYEVAKASGNDPKKIRDTVARLHESNPMLGHRGCRLGISYPEIYEMQVKAIFEAAISVSLEQGKSVIPEIMIPLVATKKELDILKKKIDRVAELVFESAGKVIGYTVGTMIELPRAALRADELAEIADFFSFGTNDLTQTTFGISRDDAASFLPEYKHYGILEVDPFVTIDVEGVGELIRIAVERGRSSRSDIKLGICGEHGGDPDSVHFCDRLGLDYVSCSPYRVPIARLAAAQASTISSE